MGPKQRLSDISERNQGKAQSITSYPLHEPSLASSSDDGSEHDPDTQTNPPPKRHEIEFFDLPAELQQQIHRKIPPSHPSHEDSYRHWLTREAGYACPLHKTHPPKHIEHLPLLTVSRLFSEKLRQHFIHHCIEYPDERTMTLSFAPPDRSSPGPPYEGWTLTPTPPPKLPRATRRFARCLRVELVHTHDGAFQIRGGTHRAYPRSVPLQSLLALAWQIRNLEELHIQEMLSMPMLPTKSRREQPMPGVDVSAAMHALQRLTKLKRISMGVKTATKDHCEVSCRSGWVADKPIEATKLHAGDLQWWYVTTRRKIAANAE